VVRQSSAVKAHAAAEPQIIRIAAAIIDDGAGSILLVRKAGTAAFMQPGGKIEGDEAAIDALARELAEELGFQMNRQEATYLGRRCAEGANEPNCLIDAELFHIRCSGPFTAQGEIAECLWVDQLGSVDLTLAPLTRDHVMPLSSELIHTDTSEASGVAPRSPCCHRQ
jgi:8-oxo-dGTP pyrophosphatase MutT (NUDIX family)